MSDECRNCEVRGDIVKCRETKCSQHDSWYATELEAENKKLRQMLAGAYSGADLYGDDGELQDSMALPAIDFRRDSVDEIDRKMNERALRTLKEANK